MKNLLRNGDDVPIPPSKLVEVMRFTLVLAMIVYVGIGFAPGLAESVTTLVGFDQYENARKDKEARESQLREEAFEREEILWFARAIHSETKNPKEMEFVSWVIRNRVESEWYPNTYKEVVLQKHQFSGLNSSDRHYELNISRNYGSTSRGWSDALYLAQEIYEAPDSARVLPRTVTHFYSPVAISAPSWAVGKVAVNTITDATGTRFAFYSDIR